MKNDESRKYSHTRVKEIVEAVVLYINDIIVEEHEPFCLNPRNYKLPKELIEIVNRNLIGVSQIDQYLHDDYYPSDLSDLLDADED